MNIGVRISVFIVIAAFVASAQTVTPHTNGTSR